MSVHRAEDDGKMRVTGYPVHANDELSSRTQLYLVGLLGTNGGRSQAAADRYAHFDWSRLRTFPSSRERLADFFADRAAVSHAALRSHIIEWNT